MWKINKRLNYLDDILLELSKTLGSFESEDIIAPKVCFESQEGKKWKTPVSPTKEGIPIGFERAFFRTATIYLQELGLIIREDNVPGIPNYMISYKGLELIENGGLIRQRKKENLKHILQILFWLLAFLTFAVNTIFQVLNYYY